MDSLGGIIGADAEPPLLNDAAPLAVEFHKAVISSRLSRATDWPGANSIKLNCLRRRRWWRLQSVKYATTFPNRVDAILQRGGWTDGYLHLGMQQIPTYWGEEEMCRNLNGMDGTIRM